MSWLYQESTGQYQGPKQYLDAEFTYVTPTGVKCRVIASALVKFRTYYGAVEHVRTDGHREVFAVICLVDYNPRREDPMRRFGYKDMDETSSPVESDCPAAILDLLTPTASEDVLSWRRRCRENLAKKQTRSKPKDGDSIHFETPVYFGEHRFTDFVVKIRSGTRTVLFTLPNGAALYRIRKWQDRPHTITPARAESIRTGVALAG